MAQTALKAQEQTGGISGERLKSFIARIEKLEGKEALAVALAGQILVGALPVVSWKRESEANGARLAPGIHLLEVRGQLREIVRLGGVAAARELLAPGQGVRRKDVEVEVEDRSGQE